MARLVYAGITAIGERYGITMSNVFHAGDGNLHPNISFDGRDAEERHRVEVLGVFSRADAYRRR